MAGAGVRGFEGDSLFPLSDLLIIFPSKHLAPPSSTASTPHTSIRASTSVPCSRDPLLHTKDTKRTSRNITPLTQDDHARRSISDLLILRPRELDHRLGRRVSDVDFSENCMSIIREQDAAHGVQNHLQHGLGTETSSDDIGDSLCVSQS